MSKGKYKNRKEGFNLVNRIDFYKNRKPFQRKNIQSMSFYGRRYSFKNINKNPPLKSASSYNRDLIKWFPVSPPR